MYMACLPQIRPHYARGCWHALIAGVGNHLPYVVPGDNTTPISNDGIARLGPMVQSQVCVLAGAYIMFSGVGLTLKRLLCRLTPHHWVSCNPELGLA